MYFPFTIDEFCIVDKDIPIQVADKILQHHILPAMPIRRLLGAPMTASKKSGYRPRWYELEMGRSGNSEHTFTGPGAIDWTTRGDIEELLELLKERSPYTRICYYPNDKFIHCDYAGADGLRYYYQDTGQGWKFIMNLT